MAASFVRVKFENGSEGSVSEGFAKSHNLKPLDKPAADARGRALPEKHKTTVAASASGTAAPAAKKKDTNPSGDSSNKED